MITYRPLDIVTIDLFFKQLQFALANHYCSLTPEVLPTLAAMLFVGLATATNITIDFK